MALRCCYPTAHLRGSLHEHSRPGKIRRGNDRRGGLLVREGRRGRRRERKQILLSSIEFVAPHKRTES